jgi:ipoprotein LpqH
VKRSVTVAAAATAIVVVGLSGCSSNKSSTSSSGSSSGQTSAAAAGSSGTTAAKVTIDGKDQNVQGTVACTSMAGTVNIAVGGTSTGIGAVLTDANPPAVKSVGLGSVNGVVLGYTQGTPQGNASATKDGSKYKISGTATGVDATNPMAGPVSKSFEIDVTCP